MKSRSRSRSASSGFSSRSRSRSRSMAPAMPTSINRIVVDQLSKNVTKEHIQEIFSAYGTIKNINLPMNSTGTAHMGKADIEYETVEQAEAALKHMDRGQLDGNLLFVDFWKPELMQPKVGGRKPLYPGPPQPYYRRSGGFRGNGAPHFPRRRQWSPPRAYRGGRSPYNRERSPPRGRSPYAQRPSRSPARGRSPPPRQYSPSRRQRSISRTPPRYRSRSISRTPPRRRSPSRSRTPPRRPYRSPSYSRTPPRYRRSRSRTPPRRY